MFRAPPLATDLPAFARLPVRLITLERAGEEIAVHVAGRLASGLPVILCIPGYARNMSDFTEFVPLLHRVLKTDWPVVLVDLRGRGRSSRRRRGGEYSTVGDAHDLSTVTRALGIGSAIAIGEGHGGQVAMALALERPTLLAGAVLLDAGPQTAAQSLIRLRSNARTIGAVRGEGGLTVMLRRMLATTYPDAEPELLDRLVHRSHRIGADGRALPLYDPALITRLAHFGHDDVLVPQWPLFDQLKSLPLLFLRTEHTDQLPREVLEEMMRRRPDALSLAITRQGSPALLDRIDEVGAIGEFIRRVAQPGDGRR